jgi:hypothetical protein
MPTDIVTTPEMFIAGSPHTRLSPVPPAHQVLFQILLSEPMLQRQNGDGGDRLPPHQTAQALHRDVQELRRLFSVQEILMIHRQIRAERLKKVQQRLTICGGSRLPQML